MRQNRKITKNLKHRLSINGRMFKPWRAINRVELKQCTSIIPMPEDVNTVVIKNKTHGTLIFYMYSANVVYATAVDTANVRSVNYFYTANAFKIESKYFNKFFGQAFDHVTKLLKIFTTMFFFRIKVIGRLYRIYTRNKYKDLMYRMGHTHFFTIYVGGFLVKFIKKKQIRLYGYDTTRVYEKVVEIRNGRRINIYTMRGIRIGGRIWKWKIGKVRRF